MDNIIEQLFSTNNAVSPKIMEVFKRELNEFYSGYDKNIIYLHHQLVNSYDEDKEAIFFTTLERILHFGGCVVAVQNFANDSERLYLSYKLNVRNDKLTLICKPIYITKFSMNSIEEEEITWLNEEYDRAHPLLQKIINCTPENSFVRTMGKMCAIRVFSKFFEGISVYRAYQSHEFIKAFCDFMKEYKLDPSMSEYSFFCIYDGNMVYYNRHININRKISDKLIASEQAKAKIHDECFLFYDLLVGNNF